MRTVTNIFIHTVTKHNFNNFTLENDTKGHTKSKNKIREIKVALIQSDIYRKDGKAKLAFPSFSVLNLFETKSLKYTEIS